MLCDTAPEQIEIIEASDQSPDKSLERKTENKAVHMTYPKNTVFNI